MKTCIRCEAEKPLQDFSKDSSRRDGHHPYCKSCNNKKYSIWASDQPKETMKRRLLDSQRRFKYGIEPHEFNNFVAKQDFKCAICGDELDLTSGGKYAIDHNHDTEEVRGILCKPCNSTLGFARDNPSILHSAGVYLEQRGHYGHH